MRSSYRCSGDLVFDLGERLLAFVVVLQHLQDQVALLGLDDVGQTVLLHGENCVFEFLGKFAALVNRQEAALLGGAAVGQPLGDFAKIFAVLNALQRGFGFFLQVRQLASFFPSVLTMISRSATCSGRTYSFL